MDNNSFLMIVLAFVVGYMCSGMMKQMCGGRLVEGTQNDCDQAYNDAKNFAKSYIDSNSPACKNNIDFIDVKIPGKSDHYNKCYNDVLRYIGPGAPICNK